ncbi:polysaccharide biosynthesis tyrosine autokinase [Algoriphagus sp.]|jgi:capsular exopolysaccharide synthesis family protein|uniref:GumC family protein n=1 Tax=Algoriphagus sp. TaxID=1872435 RepID=UPI00271FC825|nr:polysaccharide biosynthesis tyrosine autokinase [Algoriphagus sp.]MDO8965714.1 polysaccharide biosynthesis tyrosine autokinase [Algoriphagus sp.]MDP3202407.1 polysaccharide biosynthesis tyrosine autokinase [Algoriphagus sp.]
MYPNSPQANPGQQSPFMVNQEDEIDLKVILFNYLQYWPLIIAFAFLGLLSAFLFNRLTTPIYKVESTVIVKDDNASLGSDLFESAGLMGLQGKSNIENEIGILKSFSLAQATLDQLNLNVKYYKEDFLKKTESYGNFPIYVNADWTKSQVVGGLFKVEVVDENTFLLSVAEDEFSVFNPKDPYYKTKLEELALKPAIHRFGDPVKGEFFEFIVEKVSALPQEVFYFQLIDTPSLALSFREKLSAAPSNKQSSIVILSLETPLRRLGEDYLNKLMETYLQRELDDKNRTAENTIQFIDQQLSGITDSLRGSENKLQKYRSENKIFNLSQEGSIIFERLSEFEKEKGVNEINLKYLQTLRNYLASGQAGEMVAPSIVGTADPLLNTLVQSLSEMQADRVRLTANFSDQTPQVRDINARIQNTTKALQENVNSAIVNTQNVLADLNGRIRTIEREINSLPATERQLLSYTRQFTINENIYIYFLQKKAEAEITQASNMPSNMILDYGKSGQLPVAPKRSLNLLIGLILGLILPIGFITIKDFLNTKIEDPKELEKQIKVPLIGMIGRNSSEDALPVFNSPRSSVTESFRSLRADLAYLSPQRQSLTLLFTSSISGEGKTFVSMNMASVFALMGKKTILIGLDLRKPRIAQDFGLINDKGMSTCLSSDKSWQSVVKPSGYENLDVILSGPIPPNPAELLLQDKFRTIIEEIKLEYDVVVFDCPPVGLVSETKELFGFADVSFYVFRQGYSNKADAQILNNLVEKGGITKIYGILNDLHIDKGYGYGYGYGYGSNSYGYHEEVYLPWWKRALRIRK